MSAEAVLEPCPFCVFPAKEVFPNAVRCTKAECALRSAYMSIEQWNTRPIETALRQRIAALEKEINMDKTPATPTSKFMHGLVEAALEHGEHVANDIVIQICRICPVRGQAIEQGYQDHFYCDDCKFGDLKDLEGMDPLENADILEFRYGQD